MFFQVGHAIQIRLMLADVLLGYSIATTRATKKGDGSRAQHRNVVNKHRHQNLKSGARKMLSNPPM